LNITGAGFPLNSSGSSNLNVQIGGNNCSILQIANNYVIVTVPPKSSSTSNIVLSMRNLMVTATTYNYNDSLTPTISAVSPATSSPSQKSVVTINGTGFGNDSTQLTVLLANYSNNSIYYQLSIINVTSTCINAILSGGRAGIYQVQIMLAGIGNSIEAQVNSSLFAYDISITSVSPTTGSIYGGTVITILGNNFSPIITQNQVFIGITVNNFCDIIFSNFACIICQTRLAPNGTFDTPQTILVTQRVQDNAVCRATGGCLFTFVSSTSPQINSSSLTSQAGNNVTLVGTYLAPSAGNQLVTINFINGTSQNNIISVNASVTAFQVNSTAIAFVMPSLREGIYNIQVVIGNVGWAFINPSFTITNPILAFGLVFINTNMNLSKTGSYGGLMITLLGNGFYNESILIKSSYTFGVVYSINSTAITFSTNRLGVATYQISVYRSSNSYYTCNANACSFTTIAKYIPTINAHNCSNANMSSSFILNGNGTLLNSTNFTIIATLDFYNMTSNYWIRSFNGTFSILNSTNIMIGFSNIPMGTYKLNLYYAETGFAYIGDPYKTISVLAAGISAVQSSIQSSFMGGNLFNISGSGLSVDWTNINTNNISICGSFCNVVNSSINLVQCTIPSLNFAAVTNYYNLSTQMTLPQTNYLLYSDNPSSQNKVNDNNLNTMYDSSSAQCYLLFDFGTIFNINLTQIQYYPSLTHLISDFYGMKFQVSNDNSTFLDLFTLDQNIKTGWNTWTSNMTIPTYRYIKFLSNSTTTLSRCNLAEIDFNGISNYVGSQTSLSSTTCNASVQMSGTNIVLNSAVVYTQASTPVVQSITPPLGPTSGGTVITISGSGFGSNIANVIVLFDGNACLISSVNPTTIVCTTSARYKKQPFIAFLFLKKN